MIPGIRARLLVAVGLVVAVAIAGVGYLSSRIARSEFHKFLLLEDDAGGASVSRDLLDRLDGYRLEAGSWEGAGDLLAKLGARMTPPARLVVLEGNGSIAAASTPELAAGQAGFEGDMLRIRTTRSGEDSELVLRGGWTELHDPGGAQIGWLVALPPDHETGAGPESRFMLSVNRWLLVLVGVGGLLALGFTTLVARRILAPIEELTAAARAMEGGDLGRRVPVRSRDELGQLGAAFNAMAEGLQRVETLRRRMVSDVAHELRSPLTSIRCQIEALRDGLVAPSPEAIGSIEEDIVSLQRLIDDLQDLALAEAGQIRLERRPVVLSEESSSVIHSLSRDGGPPITFDLDGLPDADVDPVRFRQILANLLSNAITHTPPQGAIAVTGRAADDWIELTVKDSGDGIGPGDLPHVFERFYRADPSRQRASGGAGIGLSIAKELVEAHGGRIRAESRPGEGAAFIFTVPAACRGNR